MATAPVPSGGSKTVDEVVSELEGKLARLAAREKAADTRKATLDEAKRLFDKADRDREELENEIEAFASKHRLELMNHFGKKEFRLKNGIVRAQEDVESWEYPKPTEEQKAAAKARKESITDASFLMSRIETLIESTEKSRTKPEYKAGKIAILKKCIRTKREPDKDAIKSAGDAIWKSLGVKRTVDWNFKITTANKEAKAAKKKGSKKTAKKRSTKKTK